MNFFERKWEKFVLAQVDSQTEESAFVFIPVAWTRRHWEKENPVSDDGYVKHSPIYFPTHAS